MENHGLFEKFLSGEMSDAERSEFLNRLASDPQLEKEFRVWTDIDETIVAYQKREDFRKQLMNVSDEYFSTDNNKLARKISFVSKGWMKVAASFAALAIIGIAIYLIFFSVPSYNEIYADLYSPLKTDVITRSSADSTDKTKKTFVLYQEGKYKECIRFINSEFSKDSLSTQLQIVLGLSYMETGDHVSAAEILEKASADKQNIMHGDCLWYLSLCYLKLEQLANCSKVLKELISTDPSYSEKARSLLDKIE